MKKLQDLNDLYKLTINDPKAITKEDALKIIRELIWTMDGCGLGDYQDDFIDRQLEEINEILGVLE